MLAFCTIRGNLKHILVVIILTVGKLLVYTTVTISLCIILIVTVSILLASGRISTSVSGSCCS